MSHPKTFLFLTALCSGFFLAVLFCFLFARQTTAFACDDYFVSPNGEGNCSQSSPCSLPAALSKAEDGDTIIFAQGTYTGSGAAVITLTHSVNLIGGWDGAPSGNVRTDPESYPSVLYGEGLRRVIFITSGITTTIEGFVISGGNASNLGGGFTSGSDAGGGVYADGATVILQHNVITDNIGSTVPGVRAFGGGVYIAHSPVTSFIGYNQVLSNTAGIGIQLADGGGAFINGPALVVGNLFERNTGCIGCTGQGGGLNIGWSSAADNVIVQGNTFTGNTAGKGAGLLTVWSSVTVQGNHFLNNQATWGGGMQSYYDLGSLINGNYFSGNQSSSLGAAIDIVIVKTPPMSLTNNILINNHSPYGAMALRSDWHLSNAFVAHNTFYDNDFALSIHYHMTTTMMNNVVVSNTLGISTTDATAVLTQTHTLFWANGNDGLRGEHPIDGDPAFAHPEWGDLHLTSASPAIDAGLDAGLANDFDGEARPSGGGYDIGADEFSRRLFLPLVNR